MCNDIYTWYLDCGCSVYQNTFHCHVVQRCQLIDDVTLRETICLPARPSKMPPGLLPCKRKVATRPQRGYCSVCRRAMARAQKLMKKEKEKGKQLTKAKSAPVLSSISTMSSVGSNLSSAATSAQEGTPSPDGKALAQVRDSFMKVAEERRPSPLASRGDDEHGAGKTL